MRISSVIIAMFFAVTLSAQLPDPVKCSATTKAGTQCTRSAQEGSQLCWQHGKAMLVQDTVVANQCTAMTKAGNRCRNKTKSDLCGVHKN